MKYYDTHTHLNFKSNSVKNVIIGWDDPTSKGYYCAGAHPLFYEWTKDLYSQLLKISSPKAAVAIGECGFDKRSPMTMEEQREIFITHILVSEELKKPLIIHCVGYFDQIIKLRKEVHPTQDWIIHGYRKNPQLAAELVRDGFYFSLGGEGVDRVGLLSVIPMDRLFLETDENADESIEDIYMRAAQAFGVEVQVLDEAVEANFERVFLKK